MGIGTASKFEPEPAKSLALVDFKFCKSRSCCSAVAREIEKLLPVVFASEVLGFEIPPLALVREPFLGGILMKTVSTVSKVQAESSCLVGS